VRAIKKLSRRSNSDKALQDAVKKLNKNSSDENATQALPILYLLSKKTILIKKKNYTAFLPFELSRWDKIVTEYEYLQDAYDAIIIVSPLSDW